MKMLRSLALSLLLATPALAQADPGTALRAALNEAGRANWPEAQRLATASSAVGQDIIEWQRLRAGEGLLGEYESFLARRPDWPGLPYLKQKGEVAVARSTTPERVLAWFGTSQPATGTGALAAIRALTALGRPTDAETEARRAWGRLPFTPEDEAEILALMPAALAPLHETRLENLLWQNETAQAERMIPHVSPGWAALARARIALKARADGVTALVEAVPAPLRNHPLLAEARFDWRMSRDLTEDATALLLEHSTDAAKLGRPEAWATRRAGLARLLLRTGQPQTAYRVAAQHHLTAGADYAELEFLAGFIALRALDDPDMALRHFGHLKSAVVTPISVSRAHYWEGRAHEAKGDPAAAESYRAAARHQTAYYGQLAAERLGLPLDATVLSAATAGDWRQAGFARSSVLEAALLLLKAGDRTLGKRFMLHLAESLSAQELAQLADLALAINEPHIAVLLAKQGAERGMILPAAYFPLTTMVPDNLAISRALALSISRRESEFDPAAQSHAGARGLMQLMPATAKLMAEKTGQAYDLARLTADPAYNATLGASYLAQLVEEFGPSIALVASGYNAGPGRPRRWITELGDPRRPDVDIVDWVEAIPFTETRTYVMRVAESLTIYRAKLRGGPGPIRLTAELKG